MKIAPAITYLSPDILKAAHSGNDKHSALETVIADYCDCQTDAEVANLDVIEVLIRQADGRVYSMSSSSGHYSDWGYG